MNQRLAYEVDCDRPESAFPDIRQPEQVLVVDDDESTRYVMTEAIQELGLHVTTAESGTGGWERFEQDRPDVVVTDVRMPHGDGLALTERVTASAPSCPVIIVTGYGGEQAAIAALKAGATDYLVKPFELSDFQRAVERACSLVRARFQNTCVIPAVTLADSTVTLNNHPEMIGAVINLLVKTLEECLPESELLHVRVVLQELIMNAIEHGNLNISAEEKAQALMEGRFERLIQERRLTPEYTHRRVTVSMRHDVVLGTVQFRVRDQGHGFDWRSMLNRDADQLPLTAGSGRGIFLVRTLIPEVTYHHKGNDVSFSLHYSGPKH